MVATQDQLLQDNTNKVTKLEQEHQELQTRVTGKPLVREIRQRIWEAIALMLNAKWSYLLLIQEEVDMTRKVKEDIQNLQNVLQDNPTRAQALIEFVNILSKEALLGRRIEDITTLVIKANRWLTKRQLVMTTQSRNAQMIRDTRSFKEAF